MASSTDMSIAVTAGQFNYNEAAQTSTECAAVDDCHLQKVAYFLADSDRGWRGILREYFRIPQCTISQAEERIGPRAHVGDVIFEILYKWKQANRPTVCSLCQIIQSLPQSRQLQIDLLDGHSCPSYFAVSPSPRHDQQQLLAPNLSYDTVSTRNSSDGDRFNFFNDVVDIIGNEVTQRLDEKYGKQLHGSQEADKQMQKRIDELEKDLANLSSNNKILSKLQADLLDKMEQYQEKLSDALNKIGVLTAQKQKVEKKHSSFEEKYNTKKKALQEMEKKWHFERQDNKQKDTELKKKDKEVKKKDKELNKNDAELKKKDKELNDFRAQVEKMQNELMQFMSTSTCSSLTVENPELVNSQSVNNDSVNVKKKNGRCTIL